MDYSQVTEFSIYYSEQCLQIFNYVKMHRMADQILQNCVLDTAIHEPIIYTITMGKRYEEIRLYRSWKALEWLRGFLDYITLTPPTEFPRPFRHKMMGVDAYAHTLSQV